MQSKAVSVAAYLADLPPEKRALVADLRDLVRENLPQGYVEAMNWGMTCYEVPLAHSGKTYNGKPLMYAAIGAQKNHVGLYLCGLNCLPALRERFEQQHRQAGIRLDMGKACIRIKSPDQIHREAVAEAVAAVSTDQFIAAARR